MAVEVPSSPEILCECVHARARMAPTGTPLKVPKATHSSESWTPPARPVRSRHTACG